jgi:hypothetical protein
MASALDGISQVQASFPDGNHYKFTFQGKSGEVNQQALDSSRAQLSKGISAALDKVQQRADDADGQYSTLKTQQTKDTSGKVITWIINTIMVDDPGPVVGPLVASARAGVASARGALGSQVFVAAANALIKADGEAGAAKKLTQAYFDGVISSAGTLVTGLEFVKFACEVTLSIGGGPAGFLGGLAMTVAEDVAPAAYGDQVDWTKLAVDVVIDTLMNKFKVGDAIEKAVLEQLAVEASKKVSEKVMKEILAKVIATQLKTAMSAVVKAGLQGKPMTWQELISKVNKAVAKKLLVETLKEIAKQ